MYNKTYIDVILGIILFIYHHNFSKVKNGLLYTYNIKYEN